MDTARQFISMTSVRMVTAEEVARKFQGDIPAAARFHCPSCDRPVHFHHATSASGKPGSRSVRAHFRHAKNDPVARFCERYQAGIGADPRTEPPALPMFLRRNRDRDSSMFHLELSVRRRSFGHDLETELREDRAAITVDGVPYDLAELVADRKHTIRLANPTFRLTHRITVPEQWQRNVGAPENGEQLFIFTAEFGAHGGRRLTFGAAVKSGFDYYAVVHPKTSQKLGEIFNIAEKVGEIETARGNLLVVRIVILGDSPNRQDAEFWLAAHNFRLTSLDFDPVPVWPPQLRSNGIDEPLFSHSPQIYQTPFIQPDAAPMAATLDMHAIPHALPHSRLAAFLGFAPVRRLSSQIEDSCCFLRASRYLPWSAYMLSHDHPSGLTLADPPALSPLESPMETNSIVPPSAPILQQVLRQATNKHYDIALARTNLPARHGTPPSISIARIRSAHR